jgi:hypothetical protein
MPHIVATVEGANRAFGAIKRDATARDRVRSALQSSSTVLDAAERLDMLSELDDQGREDAALLLRAIPAGLQAGLLSALDNAAGRSIPVQFAWKPGYDFELQIWEATEGDTGGMTVMLVSPWPRHLRERK